MPHLDLGTYLADDALVLDNVPIGPKGNESKSYTVKSPSAKFTLQLRRMMELWGARGGDAAPSEADVADLVALTTGEDGQPVDFRKRLLGDVHDQMVEDGISGERLQMISNIVMAHYGSGAHVAEAIVAGLGESTARPNRATRRATPKATAGGKSRRASGGSAKRTPAPASPDSSTSPNAPEAAATA